MQLAAAPFWRIIADNAAKAIPAEVGPADISQTRDA